MFKPSECGNEARFKLIKQFARNSRLKVMLRTVSACQCSLGAMCKYHRCQQYIFNLTCIYSTVYTMMHAHVSVSIILIL